MKKLVFCAFVCTLFLVMSTQVFAVNYTITDLGTLSGTISEAISINNYGQIIGYGGGSYFLYENGKGMSALTNDSSAESINDAGQIVGSYYDTNTKSYRACLYSSGSEIIDIGTLGGTYSSAHCINNAGQIVGNSTLATNNTHAFLYASGVGMGDLGVVEGDNTSGAYGINDAGQVVGSSGSHAYVCNPQTGMTNIDTMNNYSSEARAINNSGQVVGTFKNTNTPNTEHAFIYSVESGMIDVGTLADRYMSYAYDINDSGWVVGSSGNPDNHDVHAFVYNSEDGMVDLGTLGGLQSCAYGINNYGQIVGWSYTADGYRHATLWTPVPEPASILTILSGMAATTGVALKRRRRA